ncbi:DUF4351 domain-containing protein [Synechococcus elongatus]|uniref:DUF4351 domain-containing protein n=1 Tax=Synechococcus elongatus TaxID=32046 RepID=UPI0030D0B8B2
MPYVTSVERINRQEGRLEGIARIILRQLPKSCGALSPEMVERVQALSLEQMQDLGVALLDFGSIQDLEAWLSQQEG